MNVESDEDSNPQGEDEIDPVEVVRRAVEGTDKTEFDDGHELKQLIKNANGVTLPEAGKFLLKALREDEPPLIREGSRFVVTESGKVGPQKSGPEGHPQEEERGKEESEQVEGGNPEEERDEDDGGEKENGEVEPTETDSSERSDGYSTVPEEFKQMRVWSVRKEEDESGSEEKMSFGDAVGVVTEEDAKLGYFSTVDERVVDEADLRSDSIATLRIEGCLNDEGELEDWVPELPINGEYAEVLPSGDGYSIPVLGYDPPGWWGTVYPEEDRKGVEVITEGFVGCTGQAANFVETGEGETNLKRGGREIDGWLARVIEEVGGGDTLETEYVADADIPPVEDMKLTDEQIKECLEYVDPDLPYPEWRRIGYALLDNYTYEDNEDETEKAQRVFDAWSRRGSKYGDGAKEYFGDILKDGGGTGVTVGYLIHRACKEGWVWEANDGDEEGSRDEVRRETEVQHTTEGISKGEFDDMGGGYGYRIERKDGSSDFLPVTNFTLETQGRIEHPERGEKYLRLTVRPESEEEYNVLVETKAFNTVERFKDEVVTGFTTRFDGDERALSDIRESVGGEGLTRKATETAGLHGDGAFEFVTPNGTLTEEGWEKNPDTVFVGGSADFEHRWVVSPEGEGDEGDVAEILELLPEIRQSEKFLTVLGWFYAAPLKPLLFEWSGEFPVLSVRGGTESDKDATLRLLQRAFGTDGEPLYVDSEPRSQLENFSSSCSIPLWYDGYHPSRIRRERLDNFHDYCRKTTRCTEETTHAPNGSRASHRLTAPVVVTGEEIQDPYLSERSMVTEFETRTVEERRESHRRYGELVGESYYGEDGELRHPEGLSLGSHAIEYYSWISGRATDELEEKWEECRRDAERIVRSRGVDSLRGTELQGVRITLFGLRMYQNFAEEMGAEPAIDAEETGKEDCSDRKDEDAELLRTSQDDD